MNQRIRELAKRAGGEFYISGGNQTPTWYFKYDDCQKFAELIVKECADVAVKFHLAHPYSVEYQVKKHFGVE